MTDDTSDPYVSGIEDLHARRVARLLSPEGWLGLVAKGFLHDGVNVLGAEPSSEVVFPEGAPARVGTATLSLATREVRFTAAPGVDVASDGAPIGAREIVMTSDAHARPSTLVCGRFSFQLMERGDAFAIRVRDPESPARRTFKGIERFPVDPRWCITARFVPHDVPREVEHDFEGESGIRHAFLSPGIVELEVDGGTHRLEVVYEDDTRRRLFVLFGDATNGKETYPIGRFLYTALPENGRVLLDFNTAMLPACAFTDWATCPLPVPGNKLAVRIAAGEKNLRK